MGIGQAEESRIELIGATVDELRMEWEPAQLTEGFLDVLLPGLMLLTGG